MASRNQPSYDFLTGAANSPPPIQGRSQIPRATSRPVSHSGFRDTMKSTVRAADPLNEELRVRVQTLEYKLKALREERDLAAAQSAQDLANAERQAQKEFERAQGADAAKRKAEARLGGLQKEADERETRWENEKAGLERKARELGEEAHSLREDAEEARAALAEAERGGEWRVKEAEGIADKLRVEVEQSRQEAEQNFLLLQAEKQRVQQKEDDVARLEADLMKAKANGGDSDTLNILKGQLSEQVAQVRKLEMQNQEEANELKALRQQKRVVELVEEQKRVLEAKVHMMNGLRKELVEAQLRKQALEDERQAWHSYLEAQDSIESGMVPQFDSPEDMAKAFMDVRLENAGLVEKVGSFEPDMALKDEKINSLEEEKSKLTAELETLKTAGANNGNSVPDGKARARLDRQRALAVKEVEYLRAQLQSFDAEVAAFKPEQVDELKAKRIKELEDLVDQYRNELQGVQADLTATEEKLAVPQPAAGSKRKHDDTDAEEQRDGEYKRKYRKLQTEYTKMETRATQYRSQLKAKDAELEALKAPARTRILELKNNPTSNVEKIKMTTLASLREENAGLHSLLEKQTAALSEKHKFVPAASLAALQAEMDDLSSSLGQEKKLGQRRKDLYAAKAGEFKDAVLALVGWKVNFLPNGRVKVGSIFNNDEAMEERGEENTIEFNVEKETMKVSGGLESEFARRIRPSIEYWVEGKKEIPCFLAALTLELFEEKEKGEGGG